MKKIYLKNVDAWISIGVWRKCPLSWPPWREKPIYTSTWYRLGNTKSGQHIWWPCDARISSTRCRGRELLSLGWKIISKDGWTTGSWSMAHIQANKWQHASFYTCITRPSGTDEHRISMATCLRCNKCSNLDAVMIFCQFNDTNKVTLFIG